MGAYYVVLASLSVPFIQPEQSYQELILSRYCRPCIIHVHQYSLLEDEEEG
jgi:hypothetical protein